MKKSEMLQRFEFQFLIGMVSTERKRGKTMKKLYFVSIPYRYGIYNSIYCIFLLQYSTIL